MTSAALRRLLRAAPALLVLAACSRDEITAPTELVEGSVTVDATSRAYLSLAEGRVVTPADPLTSASWDLALNATTVTLNGGQAGPGGVTGYCVCQNSAANPGTDQILAMTAEGELADFTAVTAADIPAPSAFVADELTPAIAGWHGGTGAGATPAADKAWLVRLRDDAAHAKLRVVGIQGATAATPGRVTLEYAVQATPEAALGPVRTLAVDVPAGGTARVDLIGGATTESATAWDLRFDGWTLRLNGGTSGAGRAAAAVADQPFADVTTAVTATQAYRTDSYGGVFADRPWYRYNLLGDHRVSPTFDVYLVRRGGTVYKVQLTSYYGPAGETRRITVRYEQLAG